MNDVILAGTKLQRDVLEILLRFRLRPVALVGDIKEMFSQVVSLRKTESITDSYEEILIPQSLSMSMKRAV